MILTGRHVAEIVDLLMDSGVSPFNVLIRQNGTVAFWSPGLEPGEVEHARRELAEYLCYVNNCQNMKVGD